MKNKFGILGLARILSRRGHQKVLGLDLEKMGFGAIYWYRRWARPSRMQQATKEKTMEAMKCNDNEAQSEKIRSK